MHRRIWTHLRGHPVGTAAWLAVTLVVVAGYAAVHGRLLIHYLDDAWSTSFAWQWIHHGRFEDVVFRQPGTMPLLFGKTHAVALALLGEPLGWTRCHMHLVSTAAIFGTGAAWYGVGRRVGLARESAAVLGFSLVLFQPLVLAANLARPDAVTLLLVSLSMLALVHQRFLWAGLAAAVAVECHLMGVTAFFYGTAYLWVARHELFPDRPTTRKRWGALALGVALGGLWFVAVNAPVLNIEALRKLWHAAQDFGPDRRSAWTWLDHAFSENNHVELAVFIAALALYVARPQTRREPLALAWLAAILFCAALVRRQNGFYVVYAFPAFTFLTVRALEFRPWLLRLAFAALVVSFGVRAEQTWQERRSIHFESTLRQVVAAVPQDGLPVVGLTDYWFGFQQRGFVPSAFQGDFRALGLRSFYLVDSTIKPTGFQWLRPELQRCRLVREIARFPDSATTEVRIELREAP